MHRDILHVSIPAFPIALARVVNSSLREWPVAVAPSHTDRAIVQCVSSEARNEGIFEGMPVFRALAFCPSLTILPPNPRLLSTGMRSLIDLSSRYTPLAEPNTPGRLYLDLTGSRRLLGPGRDAAARLDREITDRLRLRGSVGVAGNKLVSGIASRFLKKPGVCDVLRGSEKPFIAPMPVSILPGVGSTRERMLLTDLNLRRIEEVVALSVSQLSLIFGPFAPLLHQRACGIDPSPVLPPRRTHDVTEESYLTHEHNSDEILMAELCRLVEGCGFRLRRLGKGTGKITLTVYYIDGVSSRESFAFPAPADNDMILYAAAEDLFEKACQRRVRVRGMRLTCTKVSARNRQMEMFNAASAGSSHEKLQTALDAIRDRYDTEAVRWGRVLNGPGHAHESKVQGPRSKVQNRFSLDIGR
jgi:DNA polymerase-4